MSRLLAVLVILFAIWGAYRLLSPADVMAVQTEASEDILRAIVDRGSVDAAELASVCQRMPALAARTLRDVPLRVRGRPDRVAVSGLGGRRATVEFAAETRPVVVTYDLDRYSVLGLEPVDNRAWYFLVTGNELLLADRGLRRRAVLASRNSPFETAVTFDRITPGSVLLRGILPGSISWVSYR